MTQVASDFVHINRNLSRRLHGVGVEINIGFRSNLSDLCDRLDNTSLVCGERGVVGSRPDRMLITISEAAAVHQNVREFIRVQILGSLRH